MPVATASAAAVVAWVVVNLPVYLAYPDAWGEFYRMNTSRGAEWDSWYFLFSQLTGSSLFGGDPPSLLNELSLVLFAVACVASGGSPSPVGPVRGSPPWRSWWSPRSC